MVQVYGKKDTTRKTFYRDEAEKNLILWIPELEIAKVKLAKNYLYPFLIMIWNCALSVSCIIILCGKERLHIEEP